jgi:nucleoside-diphosphate-sugar epimerase
VRALVAGAAGFVGSHLCDRLLRDGYDVIAVDNLLTGRKSNLAHLEGNPRFELRVHDVVQPFSVPGAIDWVFHLACPASPPKYLAYPLETMRTCSEGTLRLLELAHAKKAGILVASTSEIYGDPLEHPQHEAMWGNVNPIGPRSVYDEGKRFTEAMATSFHRERGLSIRIARIFNTYGPRMDPDDGRVVTNFIKQAMAGAPLTIYGDGSQTRSIQYVDDLIEGFLRLCGVEHTGPVNLGNPEEYTMLELADLVRELTGSRSEIEFRPLPVDDPRRRRPDISLARKLLDWVPRVSARDGLTRTIRSSPPPT